MQTVIRFGSPPNSFYPLIDTGWRFGAHFDYPLPIVGSGAPEGHQAPFHELGVIAALAFDDHRYFLRWSDIVPRDEVEIALDNPI
jgi:hypothetical protein